MLDPNRAKELTREEREEVYHSSLKAMGLDEKGPLTPRKNKWSTDVPHDGSGRERGAAPAVEFRYFFKEKRVDASIVTPAEMDEKCASSIGTSC